MTRSTQNTWSPSALCFSSAKTYDRTTQVDLPRLSRWATPRADVPSPAHNRGPIPGGARRCLPPNCFPPQTSPRSSSIPPWGRPLDLLLVLLLVLLLLLLLPGFSSGTR